MHWLCSTGDSKLTLKEIDDLREKYEHWIRLYHSARDMNHLVCAKHALNAYVQAINNSNVPDSDIRALEDKYAEWDRQALEFHPLKSTKKNPGENQLRVYHYLKEVNDWTPVSEIQNSLKLSQNCVRTLLLTLISENKVEKRQNLQHHKKRAEYKVNID